MATPVLMAVDDDADALTTVEHELRKRYGVDYEIASERSPQAALVRLEALRATGGEVAILLAAQWMSQMTGIEFLDRAHDLHPHAKRVLLITMGDRSTVEPVLQAMTLGWIDLNTVKPVPGPNEEFHRLITELLDEWGREHRPGIEMVRIVGERWAPRSHEFRELLDRYAMHYGFYDVDSEEGQALLRQVGKRDGPLPVVILYNGQVLTAPSNQEVADALGANDRFEGGVYDLAIVGAGPAGLSAAVYGASEGLRTILVEREAIGGQAGTSSLIRNYLGFPRGISGGELASRAYSQALLFGAEFYILRQVTGLRVDGRERVLVLSDGTKIVTRAVVLAMGVAYRRLGIPALEALLGAGVFYGAAVTEAQAMRGQRVFVAGAGNSAGQAAVHLAKYAERVTILARGGSLGASMSDYLVKEIEATDNIAMRLNTQIVDGRGTHRLEGLVLQDTKTGKTETVPAAALLILIGAEPRTDWLPPSIGRDRRGYILTGNDLVHDGKLPAGWPLRRAPLLLETSGPGVFAVGDVRHRSVKRVASAVGEGSIGIQLVHEYLSKQEG